MTDKEHRPIVELSVGAEFAGHRIDAEIKRGGMGVVYRATDLRLRRSVALKVIAPELARKPDFRARFERESSMAAAIDHPNVIPVYSAGEQGGILFTTMLWVEGPDLGDLIAREGRLSVRLAAEIVAQAAAGLDAAHASGLIHRDVKPGNILLRSHEQPAHHAYLSDFGLTKRVDGRTSLTIAGAFVGTVDYVAPEQLLGDQIDGRADVYSLGCVLFHALAGLPPYRGQSDWATLKAHESGQIPSLCAHRPDLPTEIDEVIARALAKSPAGRYPSAGELGEAVLAIAESESPPPPRSKPAVASSEPGAEPPDRQLARGETAAPAPAQPAAEETRLPARQPTVTRAAPREVEMQRADRGPAAPSRLRRLFRLPLVAGVVAIATGLTVAALAAVGVFGAGAGGEPPKITRREVRSIVNRYEIAMQANRLDGLRPLFGKGAVYRYPGCDPNLR